MEELTLMILKMKEQPLLEMINLELIGVKIAKIDAFL